MALSQINEVAMKENEEMAPLFFFLASSFNVELVYIILKGITQFSYLTCHDGKDELSKKKMQKLNLVNELDGSKTLTMNQVKIKDFNSWSDTNSNNSEIPITFMEDQGDIEMQVNVPGEDYQKIIHARNNRIS